MKKFKLYDYRYSITGVVSIKLDGVQAILKDGAWLSRKNKPLYNLPFDVPEGIYEVYVDNWNTTMSRIRSHEGEEVHLSNLYRIGSPDEVDLRLYLTKGALEPFQILKIFTEVSQLGYEGLVIYTDKYNYKVKSEETYDVEVLGYTKGTNKNINKVGALITEFGNVGTGFTDEQRGIAHTWIGSIIEVECMGLTKDSKFRHPRFKRLREDK